MRNPAKWAYVILCIVTILLLVVAGFRAFSEQAFLDGAVVGTAYLNDMEQTVDEWGNHHTEVTVWFYDGNDLIIAPVDGYSSALQAEDGSFPIYYYAEDPQICSLTLPNSAASLFGMGGILLAVCIGIPVVRIWKSWMLRRHGERYEAVIRMIDYAPGPAGKRRPYVIYAEIETDDGEGYEVCSERIYQKPAAHYKGGTVEVLLDPRNPHRYRVELATMRPAPEPLDTSDQPTDEVKEQ